MIVIDLRVYPKKGYGNWSYLINFLLEAIRRSYILFLYNMEVNRIFK